GVTDAALSGSRKDRAIARIVSFLARAVYRDIEVYAPVRVPADAPQLTVSNHFGGFSDALLLLYVLPRRPGIVARDAIWKVPVVGRLMNWIGGIPVHKPEDKGGPRSNDQMFSSCYEALDDGGHILIFPEGVTRNEPSIAPVKTGAARIALGARASGVRGIRILPVGIHYEDKAALRSRVFVNGGVPIDLDHEVDERADGTDAVDANDRQAVRDLTEEINVALRRAAPDFENWDEARGLARAAEVTLRSQLDDPRGAVPIGLRDRLANTLADRPVEQREQITEAVDEYQRDLDAIGHSDAELHGKLTTGGFLRSLVWQVIVGALLFPFALVGAAINWIPYLIVKVVNLLRVAPSVTASIKPVVAFLAFGITWGVVIWQAVTEYGWRAGVAAFVLLPVYLAATIAFVDRIVLLWRAFRRWRARSGSKGLAEEVAAHRRAIVEAVLAA
ncbi:MAG: 1-acyl-sn-glycerol-3-phosphate acyltransferase, partial [Ilumatobacteraceae bacterium]